MKCAIDWFGASRILSLGLAAASMGACESSNKTPIGLGGTFNLPTTYAAAAPTDPSPSSQAGQPIGGSVDRAVLLPGGDYSLTTLRERPAEGNIPRVLCQAPSPDWATAIAMQQQLSAKGNFFGGSSSEVSGSNSYTETIAAMAGRTAGVVALRDGLYSACQAYANGVIGKDAYALILSQYGYLLVALAGNNSSPSSDGSTDKPGASNGSAKTTASTPGAKASDAMTVAQMQVQGMHALMVACISAYDGTVQRAGPLGNTLLTPQLCTKLIGSMAESSKSSIAAAVGASRGASAGTNIIKSELPDAVVQQAQNALRRQRCAGCQTLQADGRSGAETSNAIRAYQTENGLAVNGNVKDPATLAMLGVKDQS